MLSFNFVDLKPKLKSSIMKRFIVSAIVLIALVVGTSACGSSEKCPAYSQIEQPADNPS